jgi:uncharacterized membrane protein YphA (DoxX/SURF4 family)
MPFRQSLAMTFAPLLLRLTLGLTFLWAGLGKFNAYDAITGEDAARLANVGALDLPRNPAKPEGAPEADGPSKLMYTAADFPQEVRARRMHTDVTLRLLKAAEPKELDQGRAPRQIWPTAAGGSKAVLLAWIVSVTDVAGGICVLMGLLTRLWALVLAGHMAAGLWLMVIGPAWQSGSAVLGFLPRHDPWDMTFWITPLWIFSLLCMGTALAFLGAGNLSLDRPLLGEAVRPPARPPAH